MVNGQFADAIIWVITFLIGIIITLIGMVLKQHTAHDEERLNEMKEDLEKIRKELSELK